MQYFCHVGNVELELVGQLGDGDDFAGFDQVAPGVRPGEGLKQCLLNRGLAVGLLGIGRKK